tara:strand:- start:206 stop:688 length:483 start_codon:yes stop_codon:yes gene_type:complete
MSGLIEQLKEFDIADDTVVDFTWSSGCDIMHYTDDWQDDAYSNTGVIQALSEATTQGVFFEHGNSVIDTLREDDLLENFDEGDEDADLTEYITETIMDNIWDYDFIESDVTKYDHKRGWVNMSFSLSAPWGVLKESSEYFGGDWKASARTKKNTRVSVGD